jgi:hypothetical protein
MVGLNTMYKRFEPPHSSSKEDHQVLH